MKTNNKMKLILPLVCSATLLAGCNQSKPAHTRKPIATPPNQAKRIVLTEMPEIVTDYRKGGGGIDNPNDIPVRAGKPFSIHYTDTDKIKALRPPFGKNVLSRIIEPNGDGDGPIEETWVYPLLDARGAAVYSVEIDKQKGRWQLAGYPWDSLSEVRFMVGIEAFLTAHKLSKVSEIKEFGAVEFPFVYIDAAEGRFIVPVEDDYKGRYGLDELGIQRNKLYPAEQVWAVIVKAAKAGREREIWGIGDSKAATETESPK